MATYTLIESQVLGSSAASVTFSAIPQTFTDLVLNISTQNDDTGSSETVLMTVNNLDTSIYSTIYLYSAGTAIGYGVETAQTNINDGIRGGGGSAGVGVFSNNEIYIPSYTTNYNYKPIAVSNSAERATTSNVQWNGISGNLVQTSSAITSIKLFNTTTKSFKAESSFYLYGISNA